MEAGEHVVDAGENGLDESVRPRVVEAPLVACESGRLRNCWSMEDRDAMKLARNSHPCFSVQ